MPRRFRADVIIKKALVFAVCFVFSGIAISRQFSADGMAYQEMDLAVFSSAQDAEHSLDGQHLAAPAGNVWDEPPDIPTAPVQTYEESFKTAAPITEAFVEFPYHASLPIRRELQEYTYARCRELDLDYPLVLALMWKESRFKEHAVNINTNGTQDSGIMQINDVNRNWLYTEFGIDNLMDPYQNIQAGTEMLSRFTKKHGSHNALLAYQFGEEGMLEKLSQGVSTTRQIEQLYAKRDEYSALLAQAAQQPQEPDFPE